MIRIGDKVLNGQLVVAEISEDYRVITIQSEELGDPTGPAEIKFRAGDQVDELKALVARLK